MNNLRVLTLNCQKGYHPELQARLKSFFRKILDEGSYDFLLLQEVDAKVLSFLQHPSYETVRIFDKEAEKESELCIVYRSSWSLVDTGFKSFAPLQYRKHGGGFKCPSFGVMYADIDTGAETMRLVSVHLHSNTDRRLRLTESGLVKELVGGGGRHLETNGNRRRL